MGSGKLSKSNEWMYARKVNYEEILVQFVIVKFMQFWSAKGDVAFKIGN